MALDISVQTLDGQDGKIEVCSDKESQPRFSTFFRQIQTRILKFLTPCLVLFPCWVHSLQKRGWDGGTEGEAERERERERERENEGLGEGRISIYCTILETFI